MDVSNDFVAAAGAPDSLFAQAPVSMAVLRGAELIFELVNPAFLAAVRGRQVLGRPLREALPETRHAGLDALLHDVLGGGKTHISQEVRLELDDAGRCDEAYFTFTYSRLRGPDGPAGRVMAVCHEITDQVRAREQTRG
ncbi:MAG TPA: PAS domain-containing protein, partial [Gammaproteobacteria bacterium]|nr:PAS domain-containing protein [Gammaproteobacteria bacterium]